jgi:hypothetical protein
VLVNVVGDAASCPACLGELSCPVCGGTGLSGSIRPVADAFTAEIVAHLPTGDFERRAATVAAWLRRHGLPAATPAPQVAGIGVPIGRTV